MEHSLSQIMHYALYGFMTVMPATGIAMGYYGGKGLPFFTTTIAGAKETNGTIAKNVSACCTSTFYIAVYTILAQLQSHLAFPNVFF